jgi:hypothetical protein
MKGQQPFRKKENRRMAKLKWFQAAIPTIKRGGQFDETVIITRATKKGMEGWLRKNHFRPGINTDEWNLETRLVNQVAFSGTTRFIDRNRPTIVSEVYCGSAAFICNPLGEKLDGRKMRWIKPTEKRK